MSSGFEAAHTFLEFFMSKKMIDGLSRWVRDDWKSSPIRFSVEIFAWFLTIACSVTMSLTVPNPPLLVLYPIWIVACMMYCWAAWTRRSSGMVANYLLLTTIDSVGLIRMVLPL